MLVVDFVWHRTGRPAPDHTLILANGKRRHRAAVIAWLGNAIADGTQGPDLSAIPSIALGQGEVLRDGAAAQYGSDAVADVINFELKNARSGGSMECRSGQYFDENDGTPATFTNRFDSESGCHARQRSPPTAKSAPKQAFRGKTPEGIAHACRLHLESILGTLPT